MDVDEAAIYDEADQIGKEIQLTPDGGLVKKILRIGTSWETPEEGDDVYVHYTGTLLDGTKFDSSVDRGTPFNFKLKKGAVIKGWDLGVATMKKGEKAILTCRSDYAYGKQGSPPTIPPDATLNFEVELLSWKSIKDISGDGGVSKTVLEEGKGWASPKGRDDVTVKYSARVKGAETAFEESPEEGVEFALSEGHLCKAIATAAATMKKGEKAKLLVQPSYGFGDEGRGAEVPPGAALDIDLQLLAIKQVTDITEDGLVTKKVLQEADTSEFRQPNDGSKVTVRYSARLAPKGAVFDQRLEGNELEFTVDEEIIPPLLDLAVKKMKKGEKALVTATDARYGFGAAGWKGPLGEVPAGAAVEYELELVDFVKSKDTWEMEPQDKCDAATVHKEKGNKAFKEGKLERALAQYEKAEQLLTGDKDFEEGLKQASKDVKKSCWLNLAAVQLKLQQNREAKANCTKVLDLDGRNVKALYRRAQSQLALGDYLEAELDIKTALEVEPQGADLLAMHKRIKAQMKVQNKKEAAMFGRMFKPQPADKVVTAASAPEAAAAVAPAATTEAAADEPEAMVVETATNGA